ncbi:kinase-like protein [Thelephora ganbajun]|uniref:Kinase-like protein n=1 Tax=Thelephora ganbajun TaxID=370292 RepID=A0ACB6Z6K3_THEGA|nr:kinase-like protein [Thelephora ganbajun]
MTPPNPLQQLRDLDRASRRFHEQLTNFLRGNEYRNVFPKLQSGDLAWLVEYLDSVIISISNSASVPFQESLHELRNICGIKGVLPKSCVLSESLLGCVYEGTFGGSKVRIRRVRMYHGGDPHKVKETFHQVAVTWKHLAHPNIVPLLGVTIDPFELISDRMPGRNLTEYIMNHPDADRIPLLTNVAKGLNYLHSCDVIHGDLKGSNVLVDATGHARITDFGLAMVTQDLDLIRNGSVEHGHSARWIAPEILDGRGTYSKETDVFSFAGVAIEAFTGATPFSGKSPRAATLAIMGGERPPRPTHPTLTDGSWTLIQRCWSQEPHLRPHALRISCGFGIPAWKRLIDRPLAMDESISLIKGIFSDRNETEDVRHLRGSDAQSFVDVIDEMLDSVPSLRTQCLSVLCRICGRQALLPRSIQIPLCYNQTDTPLYHGGYAEVWKGQHQEREVAVKVLKVYLTSDFEKITRRFCKEVMIWKALCHPNVLPLLGVTMGNRRFAMASEWMANGNINEFVKTRTDTNRFELLSDVARGLVYMHGEGVIHGDLKGANILIDKHDHACLADFGLVTIVSDPAYHTTSTSSTNAGTIRWMSPELLDPDQFGFKDGRPTKESDCYALGMVIYEVLSGQAPFISYKDFIVSGKVIEGERPGRPDGVKGAWFTDGLWEMLERCWSAQPKDRLAIEAVLGHLGQASTAWQPLHSGVEDDVETDDDESFFTVSYHSRQTIRQDGNQSPVSPRSHSPSVADPVVTSGCESRLEMAIVHPLTDSPPPALLDPAPERLEHLSTTCQSLPPGTDGDVGADPDRELCHIASGLDNMPGATPRILVAMVTNTTSASISLKKIVDWDGKSQDIGQALATAFEADDYLDCIKDLPALDIDPLSYINNLDKIIDGLPTDSDLRKRCIRALSATCGLYGILPTSHIVTFTFTKFEQQPFASRKHYVVWRYANENHQVFAVKSFSSSARTVFKRHKERRCKEVVVSKRMNHPNILSIEGVAPKYFEFCIVTRWMPNGSMMRYVGGRPKVNRLELLIGITRGLNYLHNNGIIHGDLRSSNVLIDTKGNPRLHNFGYCWFTKDTDPENFSTPNYRSSTRYCAPELHNKDGIMTKKSDVFSLSMIIVELTTGKVPFPDTGYSNVKVLISRNKRPPEPLRFNAPGMTPAVWKIAQECWHQRAEERPEVNVVLQDLEKLTNSAPSLLKRVWRDVFD